MIPVAQMAEFVHDHVINDSLRGHQGLPVEVQCAARAA